MLWGKAEIDGEPALRIRDVLPGFMNRSGIEALFADDIRQRVRN